jgi:hypothetical protein
VSAVKLQEKRNLSAGGFIYGSVRIEERIKKKRVSKKLQWYRRPLCEFFFFIPLLKVSFVIFVVNRIATDHASLFHDLNFNRHVYCFKVLSKAL